MDVRKEVVALGRRRGQVLGNEDRDDERVDGQDTRHDDGDKALVTGSVCLPFRVSGSSSSHLHDNLGLKGTGTGDTDARLGRAVCSTDAYMVSMLLKSLCQIGR